MRNIYMLFVLRLFALVCFKAVIDPKIRWENVRFEKSDDYYHDKEENFEGSYKDDFQSYEIARHAYEDSLTRFGNISAKIMSTSQLHGIVFAAVSLVHCSNAMSFLALLGLIFNFASIFLAVYSLSIKTELTFEYGFFAKQRTFSTQAKLQFSKVITKKNDLCDYLADAYKIITFFLIVSLIFIFIDLLPIPFLRENDNIICVAIILLWVVYKILFLAILSKFLENIKR